MEYPEPAQLLHNNDSQLHFPKSSNTLLVVPVKYSFGVIYNLLSLVLLLDLLKILFIGIPFIMFELKLLKMFLSKRIRLV